MLFFVRSNRTAPALATSSIPVIAIGLVGVFTIGIIAAIAVPGLMRARISGNEAAAIGGIRAVFSAQSAYAARNQGLFESEWKCLAGHCIPGVSGEPFLPESLTQSPRNGYRWTLFHAQQYEAGTAPSNVSPSSTNGYVVVAEPEVLNSTGSRTFCGDSLGMVCHAQNAENLIEQFNSAPFIRCSQSCTPLEPR